MCVTLMQFSVLCVNFISVFSCWPGLAWMQSWQCVETGVYIRADRCVRRSIQVCVCEQTGMCVRADRCVCRAAVARDGRTSQSVSRKWWVMMSCEWRSHVSPVVTWSVCRLLCWRFVVYRWRRRWVGNTSRQQYTATSTAHCQHLVTCSANQRLSQEHRQVHLTSQYHTYVLRDLHLHLQYFLINVIVQHLVGTGDIFLKMPRKFSLEMPIHFTLGEFLGNVVQMETLHFIPLQTQQPVIVFVATSPLYRVPKSVGSMDIIRTVELSP